MTALAVVGTVLLAITASALGVVLTLHLAANVIRRPRRTRVEHVVVDQHKPCVCELRIAAARELVDVALTDQSYLFAEDRNRELVDVLLTVRQELDPPSLRLAVPVVPGRS